MRKQLRTLQLDTTPFGFVLISRFGQVSEEVSEERALKAHKLFGHAIAKIVHDFADATGLCYCFACQGMRVDQTSVSEYDREHMPAFPERLRQNGQPSDTEMCECGHLGSLHPIRRVITGGEQGQQVSWHCLGVLAECRCEGFRARQSQ